MINLRSSTTSSQYWSDFVSSLRLKMDSDISKAYFISIMTRCVYPDPNFHQLYQKIRSYVESFIVYADSPQCNSTTNGIKENLAGWSSLKAASGTRPNVYLGLAVSKKNSYHVYLTPSSLNSTYQEVREKSTQFS